MEYIFENGVKMAFTRNLFPTAGVYISPLLAVARYCLKHAMYLALRKFLPNKSDATFYQGRRLTTIAFEKLLQADLWAIDQ